MATYTVGAAGAGGGFDFQTAGDINGFGGFVSGDFVLFNRGETFAGQLRCEDSGVTYGATGTGAIPIITGNAALSPVDITQPCTFENIRVENPGGGSARCINLTLTGLATIRNCVIDGNRAGRGIRLIFTGDLVLEDTAISETNDGIYLDGDSAIIKRVTITGGNNDGLIMPTAATMDVEIENVTSTGHASNGMAFGGSGTIVGKSLTANNNLRDGFQGNATSTTTLYGCTANSNGSAISDSGDGYTAHNTATFNIIGCTGSKNFKSGVKVVNDTQGSIVRCSFYDNDDTTIGGADTAISIDTSSGNWLIADNVTQNHRREIQITSTAVAGTSVITVRNNIYNNTREALAYEYNGTAQDLATFNTNAGDTGSIQADPLFIDAESLVLNMASNSPAIGTGAKDWGNNPRPISSSGEPCPDTAIDKGAIQSTFNVNHPSNL